MGGELACETSLNFVVVLFVCLLTFFVCYIFLKYFADQDLHAPSGKSYGPIHSIRQISTHPSRRSKDGLGCQLHIAMVERIKVCRGYSVKKDQENTDFEQFILAGTSY